MIALRFYSRLGLYGAVALVILHIIGKL